MDRRINTLVGVLLLVGCGTGVPSTTARAEDFGAAWPVVYERVTLRCDHGAVYATVGGPPYALNPPAASLLPGMHDVREIQWPGRSIEPLLDLGLSLCG